LLQSKVETKTHFVPNGVQMLDATKFTLAVECSIPAAMFALDDPPQSTTNGSSATMSPFSQNRVPLGWVLIYLLPIHLVGQRGTRERTKETQKSVCRSNFRLHHKQRPWENAGMEPPSQKSGKR
jgi:hypothetical protein